MLLHLGTRPLRSALWSLLPAILAVASFSAFVSLGEGFRSAAQHALWVALAIFLLLLLSKLEYETSAGIAAALLAFFRFGETNDPNYVITWLIVAPIIAYMAMAAFAARERTKRSFAKFLFEFTLYQGFFWSVYLIRFFYAPGDWVRSYGSTILGLAFTALFLLWWASRASAKLYGAGEPATA